MQYFLKNAAEYFLSGYGADTTDVAVIFPGKRSILYFNKYLSEITEQPVLAPAYFTITELMEKLSGYKVTEKLTLIFELFEAFKKITHTSEEIDEFFFYAEMLLADFDDIDKYLVNPEDIFQNLADLKSIENHFDYLTTGQVNIISRFWDSLKHGKNSDDKQSFITLWKSMPAVYSQFKNTLQEKGIAYEGLIYRKVAEDISEHKLTIPGYKKFIFVGFNALNKAEDKLFGYLQRQGMATFLWDYDKYYINNTIHEAGFFIRENLKKYPPPEMGNIFENLTGKDKKITFVSISSNTGQAGAIPSFIGEISTQVNKNPVNTAVVLAGESLLLPALAAIPESIEDINVTMGFPFIHSTLYHFVNCIVNLHKNSKTDAENRLRFYYKDVIALLGTPDVNHTNQVKVAEVKKAIIQSNTIYPEAEEIELTELLKLITVLPKDAGNIPGYFLNIFTELAGGLRTDGDDNHSWRAEMIYLATITFKRMKELIESARIQLSSDIVFSLILKTLAGLTIPFSGEPLKGLQVMGILETRVLDFENIIILTMNEGVFPKTGNLPTFIPLSLRYGFGLPVPEHRDAIYAYYFYRLIQRAKNVTLVYNSRHDGLTAGERSRFLHQLYFDPMFAINEKVIAHNVTFKLPRKILVEKDKNIIRILRRYVDETSGVFLTPSAVNMYLNCSLRFCFRYINGLKEPDLLVEVLDPALFGSVLHKAMELLYNPYTGKVLSIELIESIQKNDEGLSEALNHAFSEEYSGKKKAVITGKNIILKEILLKYLHQILEYDKGYAPFKIVDLEKSYLVAINLESGDKVRIGGIIDRVDEKTGELRIIDYKSGIKKNTFESINALFDEPGSKRNGDVFQIFLYSLVLNKLEHRAHIVPGLYFIRAMFNPDFDYRIIQQPERNRKIPVENVTVYLTEFEERLKGTLTEILNPDVPFTQTSDTVVCKNCPYSAICHR